MQELENKRSAEEQATTASEDNTKSRAANSDLAGDAGGLSSSEDATATENQQKNSTGRFQRFNPRKAAK